MPNYYNPYGAAYGPQAQPYYTPMPYNPAMSAQERIANLQQQMTPPAQPMPPQGGPVINARAVTGYEEANAAQIPLDGSMNIFTDLGHKQIYIKQFDNNNGTANLHVFRLVEAPAPAETPQPAPVEFVPRGEFDELKQRVEELFNKPAESKKGGSGK